VNLLGHVRVALDASDDHGFVLGAILPDLESLVGQRLEGAREVAEVVDGIALHKATDAVFHADRRFLDGSIALTRALQARGIGRGASRGVGHAGWELLLDGLLVDDAAVTDAFGAAIDRLAALAERETAVADRLMWFAARQRTQPIWAAYADPVAVADRLHRQLAARPRLAFPSHQLPQIADELATASAGVRADGPQLIGDVARAVTG
jgi:hypothetical protein